MRTLSSGLPAHIAGETTTLCRCQGPLNISRGTGNTLDRVGNIDCISQESHQRTGRGFTLNNIVTAKPENHGHTQGCHNSMVGVRVAMYFAFLRFAL